MAITELNDRRHLQAFCFHRNRRILIVERGPYPVASKSRKDIEKRVTYLRFYKSLFCLRALFVLLNDGWPPIKKKKKLLETEHRRSHFHYFVSI